MKILLLAFMAIFASACVVQPGTTPITTTTVQGTPPTTTLPPVEVEPASHMPALRITEQGLKVGGIKTIGVTNVWSGGETFIQYPNRPTPPNCGAAPQLGSTCSSPNSSCITGGKEFSCQEKKTFKIWGWTYASVGLAYPTALNVEHDQFWFVGCMVGICNRQAGPAYSDKWGYWEFNTSHLNDQVRINGLEAGYYAFCQNGKPIAGGGVSGLSAYLDKADGFPDAFRHQKILKPDSCQESKMFGLMSFDVDEEIPDNVPYFKENKVWCTKLKGTEVCEKQL